MCSTIHGVRHLPLLSPADVNTHLNRRVATIQSGRRLRTVVIGQEWSAGWADLGREGKGVLSGSVGVKRLGASLDLGVLASLGRGVTMVKGQDRSAG